MVRKKKKRRDEGSDNLSLPNSVIEYFQGYLGIPTGGFPDRLRTAVLAGRTLPNGKDCFEGRPGAEMAPYDFEGEKEKLDGKYGRGWGAVTLGAASEEEGVRKGVSEQDLLSHALYPEVFAEFKDFQQSFGEVRVITTCSFID